MGIFGIRVQRCCRADDEDANGDKANTADSARHKMPSVSLIRL